jgi:SAM-dependent methyltransferase
MDHLLRDLPAGLEEGRYREDALPTLPFEDGDFDLALCSHLLFLYSDTLSLEFHVASIRERCRVAGEARVFLLLGAYGEPSLTSCRRSNACGSSGTAPRGGGSPTSSCGARTKC